MIGHLDMYVDVCASGLDISRRFTSRVDLRSSSEEYLR